MGGAWKVVMPRFWNRDNAAPGVLYYLAMNLWEVLFSLFSPFFTLVTWFGSCVAFFFPSFPRHVHFGGHVRSNSPTRS